MKVSLAQELQNRKTYLVGTLRSNRKLNPKEVIQKKLRKGEVISRQSSTGCTVLKWNDKREVLMLGTRHDDSMTNATRKGEDLEKPSIIVDYNKSKAFIDLSDQLKSYATCLRKGVKWYRKLAMEMITGTALINAYILHQQ